jgi:hypothetical protein
MKQRWCATIAVSVALAGCGFFDSGVEWKGGPYALIWIDTADNISITRELGRGDHIGRIDATVFAVGWNGRYLVAKQHPSGDRTKVNYFVIDATADSDNADPQKVVLGPLNESEFAKKSAQLNLPRFSKVLESLQ